MRQSLPPQSAAAAVNRLLAAEAEVVAAIAECEAVAAATERGAREQARRIHHRAEQRLQRIHQQRERRQQKVTAQFDQALAAVAATPSEHAGDTELIEAAAARMADELLGIQT